MDRRDFLKKTGVVTAGSLLIPSFLRAGTFSSSLSLTKKRLVVIQLSGGNDGLNAMVPYGLDEYYQNRSNIGLTESSLLKVDDKFGFHPKLKALYDLQQRGLMSIVNSVGYPNPNRSHFRSMDIWHTGSDADSYLQTGWLGRYLDNNCTHAYEGIELNGSLSLALKGSEHSGVALTDPRVFYDTIHSEFFNELKSPETDNKELDYLYKVFNDTKNSAEYIYDQFRLKQNTASYTGKLGQQLKKIATLIKSDIQTPVFYTELGGFDTHVNQLAMQERLYDQLNSGVESFVADLEENNMLEDTTIVIFSEFGRRLKENASRGTDHGAANVMFVIDTDLNENAFKLNNLDLINLENGDPKFKVDFRSVYQDVLNERLRAPSQAVLGKTFERLNIFK